jgi:hypothetical protein
MMACASRVVRAWNWLVAFACTYFAFVALARPVTAAVRWAAALTGASVAYVLVMLAIAALWRHDEAHAAVCCAGGMAIAVMTGVWAASTILPAAHRRAGMWTCTALGVLYPALLAAGAEADAPVRSMQLLYIVASAAGGVAALRSFPVAHDAGISHGALASPRSAAA